MAGGHYPVGRAGEPLRSAEPAPGVPPLELTGERTLPDVPAENYWFRRHLAVYEWIGARVVGQRVLDMACGEGYGSDVLSRRAACGRRARRQPGGVRARPAALPRGRTSASSGAWSSTTAGRAPTTRSCSCRRSSTSRTRRPCSSTSARCWRHGGAAYISTPNVLTLAPAGAEKSDNPWHIRSTAPPSSGQLCASVFAQVELLGLFHARKLRAHALALALGWDAVHARLRHDQAVLRPVHARDRHQRLRAAARPARWGARLPGCLRGVSWLCKAQRQLRPRPTRSSGVESHDILGAALDEMAVREAVSGVLSPGRSLDRPQ